MSTQCDVLKILEEKHGDYISGESIAQTLGLSRNAIWKTIKNLRAKGYSINAKTHLGYALILENNVLSKASLGPYIKNSALLEKIKVYTSLESTNTKGKEMALAGAPDGTVILAETQSCGRGRMGRSFFSPGGSGIYLSMILRPKTDINQSLFLTICASVLIHKAITAVTGIAPKIKWVNDLYLNGKKICGILTEAAANFESSTIDYVVLGAGINFTAPKDGFPEELKNIAGALYTKQPEEILRQKLTAEIINQLSTLAHLQASTPIMEYYRKHSLVLGKEVIVHSTGESFMGTVVDINDFGHLILKISDGNLKTILSGEVSLRVV